MSKQVIDIGTSANDGTGDAIRDAFDKVNDNFTEVYSRQSPISGQGSDSLISAVKYFEVNHRESSELFFVSYLRAHHVDGANYVYDVQVWKGTDVDDLGDYVMVYTASVGTKKTGYELIALGEYDGSSYTGYMIVNWSALADETVIQCDDWSEGGIMVQNLPPERYGINDNMIEEVTADETVVDGSKVLYVCNPSALLNVKSDVFADIVGEINLVHIAAGEEVHFAGNSTETFNGVTGYVKLLPGNSCKITPYDGNFIVTGNYDSIVSTP